MMITLYNTFLASALIVIGFAILFTLYHRLRYLIYFRKETEYDHYINFESNWSAILLISDVISGVTIFFSVLLFFGYQLQKLIF